MTILIPKYQDILIEPKIVVPTSCMKGRFKLIAIRPDGRERPLTDWFDNLILNSGLNGIGTTSQLSTCHVGTSSAAVDVAQTQLQGWLAATTNIQEVNYGCQSSAPYYGWKILRYRFVQGTATGNISEVGIGYSNQSVNYLWSRALTVDGGGSPTTVTVLADEVLDVVYELRLYPPTGTGSGGPFSIGGVNYNVDWKASGVTSAAYWAYYLGNAVTLSVESSPHIAYNGLMGATIVDLPSGTSSGASFATAAYSNNSLQRDATASYDLNQGNLAGGIRSSIARSTIGLFQFEFDQAIPKDNTKTLTLTYRVSWSRYP